MNLYLLVEGRSTEPKIYGGWLPELLPGHQRVRVPSDLRGNHFYIVSGGGYPSILDRTREAIDEAGDYPVDHFVVCLDAEERLAREVQDEITAHIDECVAQSRVRERNLSIKTHVIVQDCCIESWLLGNKRVMAARPQTAELRMWYRHHNVRTLDPEFLPRHESYTTRAQACADYLRAMIRERVPGSTYSKCSPGITMTPAYLEQLRERVTTTNHLRSLEAFLAMCAGLV